MKHLFLILAAFAAPVAIAARMEGFAANYYQDDLSIPNYVVSKNLAPEIIVGDAIFIMEYSSLSDIAQKSSAPIFADDRASWLCLSAKSVNYWFISDKEMGQGNLTSIVTSQEKPQQTCSSYSGSLRVRIEGVPLLNTTIKDLSTTFSDIPENGRVQYCAETKTYGDLTQLNCLQYFIEKQKTQGVLISQVTSN